MSCFVSEVADQIGSHHIVFQHCLLLPPENEQLPHKLHNVYVRSWLHCLGRLGQVLAVKRHIFIRSRRDKRTKVSGGRGFRHSGDVFQLWPMSFCECSSGAISRPSRQVAVLDSRRPRRMLPPQMFFFSRLLGSRMR